MIELKRITGSMENRIVTGLIVSDEYCKRVLPMLHKDYFESAYAAIIFDWCSHYFLKYKESPGKNIQEIYKDRRGELEDAQRSLVREFLSGISEKYKEDGLNVEVEVDRTVAHVRKRALEVHAEKLSKALDAGKLDKAEEEVDKFRQVRKVTSGWVNPFDPAFIRSVLDDVEGELVFKFPGKLGELAKWHERGWLCAFLAPMKRGKSFMLQEVAVICALNRKKVAFFSLEMNDSKMGRRVLNRITAADPDHEGDFLYPVFDCAANQDGTCKLEFRTNKVRLLLDSGEKPQFDGAANYKPCTACRGTNHYSNYKVATWYTYRKRERMTTRSASRKAGALRSMHGDNFRMKAYPMGAANIKNIKADLDALEYTEGFVPDCIAEGSLVLTDRGLVPIEKVLLSHRLWDGENWVSHGGTIYKGVKEVITYDGLTATPDHKVWTSSGWRTLESCRKLGFRIAKTADGGRSIRLSENNFSKSILFGQHIEKLFRKVKFILQGNSFSMGEKKNKGKQFQGNYKKHVWDVVNAGPLHRFTVQGRLVKNCIVVDYADILAPEDSRITDIRHRLDTTWQQLKSLAQERHCLVFTASQGTRKSIKKKLMEQEDIAEDIRKMAHVDLMYALNQTGDEKSAGAMRISVVAHRHDDYNDKAYVTVLQQRGLAQMLLDSEIHWGPRQQDKFSKPVGDSLDDDE